MKYTTAEQRSRGIGQTECLFEHVSCLIILVFRWVNHTYDGGDVYRT